MLAECSRSVHVLRSNSLSLGRVEPQARRGEAAREAMLLTLIESQTIHSAVRIHPVAEKSLSAARKDFNSFDLPRDSCEAT